MAVSQCNVMLNTYLPLHATPHLDETTLNIFPTVSMKATLQRIGVSASSAAVMSLSLVSSAWAQSFGGPIPTLPGTAPPGSSPDSVRAIVIKILVAVLNFLALVAVVVVVIAGIRLIVSQGEDEAKDKAKKTIIYALIGLVIVLFARVIVSLITNYLASQVQ